MHEVISTNLINLRSSKAEHYDVSSIPVTNVNGDRRGYNDKRRTYRERKYSPSSAAIHP